MIRREAYVQLGLGGLALAAAIAVAWWLLLGRVAAIVWIGVIGALVLAAAFLWEGWRAHREYTWFRYASGSAATTSLVGLHPTGPSAGEAYRRRLLVVLLFGVLASVSAPGLNVLVGIVIARRTDAMDLVVWVLLVLPICLAVWMLPPRDLGPRSSARSRAPQRCPANRWRRSGV